MFPQWMSQATDDMSGWLNKDTYLSNVTDVIYVHPNHQLDKLTVEGSLAVECCVCETQACDRWGTDSNTPTGINNLGEENKWAKTHSESSGWTIRGL